MSTTKRVIALGFFDGVHLGHEALLRRTAAAAAELGAASAVLAFDSHPDTLIKGASVPLINSARDRNWFLQERCGIQDVIPLHFDRIVMRTPWQDFLKNLVENQGAVHFVVGYDFCCGYRGEGTAERVAAYCAENGLGCDVIPKVLREGILVSSTYIRELLLAGELRRANAFLGHRHFLIDSVSGGHQVGRTLGTPTINMRFAPEVLVPRRGVYAARAYFDGACYGAVTNIGVRPTFGEDGAVSVESWLLDFSGDVYGRTVRLELLDFLRPEQRFETPEALRAQILADARRAREILEA